MKTALDSNIIAALLCLEPTTHALTELLGDLRQTGVLVICGAVYAEIHAIPNVTPKLLKAFLSDTGIRVEPQITLEDWQLIAQVFANYATRRRKSGDGQGKRLLADFMVGAHAAGHCQRLLTLDPKRYRQAFPKLDLMTIP